MSADILQDKSVALNGKNDVPVVSQPITRGGLRVYKIVVLGDGGVGKSAVTLQFVSHSFLDYHDPTIEDSYQQQAVIDGEAALLDILDTAGQVEFTAMRDQYMRCGEGFMICYSVTDRHSFQEALEYRKLITRVRANEDIPLVLVGNKFDLQHQRKVTTEEGKALAEQLGCPFYETSAALRQFIDDAFYSLVRQIRAKERSRNSKLRVVNPRCGVHSFVFGKRDLVICSRFFSAGFIMVWTLGALLSLSVCCDGMSNWQCVQLDK